jgi:hypothetical protein
MQVISPTASIYTSVMQSTYKIAAGEGIFNLWRGMSSVILGAGKPNMNLVARTASLTTLECI